MNNSTSLFCQICRSGSISYMFWPVTFSGPINFTTRHKHSVRCFSQPATKHGTQSWILMLRRIMERVPGVGKWGVGFSPLCSVWQEKGDLQQSTLKAPSASPSHNTDVNWALISGSLSLAQQITQLSPCCWWTRTCCITSLVLKGKCQGAEEKKNKNFQKSFGLFVSAKTEIIPLKSKCTGYIIIFSLLYQPYFWLR